MENESYEIKNLRELLRNHLQSEEVTVVDATSRPFALKNQSYGSRMFSVEIVLHRRGMNENEIQNVVAKLCPLGEFFKQAYQVAITFKKELTFYNTIVPTLQDFQREQGDPKIINSIPKFYGGRLSLDRNSNEVDDDAVILLENLKSANSLSIDRENGFDLEKTELALKAIAQIHAVAVALKILKPEVFHKKVLSNLAPSKAFAGVTKVAEDIIINSIAEPLKLNEECKPLVPRVLIAMKKGLRNSRNPKSPSQPFATITHNDYSIDNMLIHINDDEEMECKIIDFQVSEYGSPASDILCLIFTSTHMEVIEAEFDNLLKCYYENFVNTLKNLNCDCTSFNFKQLQEEIDYYASHAQFFGIMILMRHIMCKRKPPEPGKGFPPSIINDTYLNKLYGTILYFAKRNWI